MPKSDKTVVVFHMHGCPACADYLPRFRRVAVKYRPFVAIKHVLLGPSTEAEADRYKIKAVPSTLILDTSGRAIKKVEGSLPMGEITKIFEQAAK
jgi:thiol-disulfide isomerase/thioredoxin